MVMHFKYYHVLPHTVVSLLYYIILPHSHTVVSLLLLSGAIISRSMVAKYILLGQVLVFLAFTEKYNILE